jgi:signal transduction histidine kinase/CheY-like chemotaxis protein
MTHALPLGDQSSEPLHPDSSEARDLSGERGIVWIVDDSPMEAEMARRAISPSHDVTLFADGAMMLERLSDGEAPDALVLDWQLPGMSGIEVCRFLRGTLSQIALPVVLLTSNDHKQDIVDGLAAGANDYVTKPYDAPELLARVGTLVHIRRLHERVKRCERALELERDRLLQSERRFRIIARASIALTASLDSKAASTSMMHVAVPEIADWCGIYLRGQADTVKLAADARADSPKTERAFSQDGAPAGSEAALRAHAVAKAVAEQVSLLAVSQPLFPNVPYGAAKVLDTGASDFIPDVAEAHGHAQGDDAVHLDALGLVGVASWMMVPLTVQGRAFGCLAFAITGAGRRFNEVDLALAEELGRRTAVAIDNARLFEMTQHERARVEEANHTKDEFLATVSHELRTPLSAILGWAVMLRNNTLSEEKRTRAIATIERNARSQAQLIEDLLDVSRIISGKLRLTLSPIQPSDILEAAMETVRPAAEAKGIRLVPVFDSRVGPILGDAERLQQVAWNLLSNAVKFTPKGGRVQVLLRSVDSDIHISVVDSGQGIAADFLPYVFERFRQADVGIARSHGGLGLGLAITRHLVELHGGAIQATSAGAGLGTTITVRLPLAPLSSTSISKDDQPSGPSVPLSTIVCPPEIEGLHVLLVEDEPDGRDVMAALLESFKAKVTAVGSAGEAMEAIRRSPPDVMVSDVGMPGESGYDLIRKIRSLPPDRGGRTPSVALTAYARMEDRTRALMMGFDMHVPKPIEPSELLVVIAHLAKRFAKA